jgi:hypothetical protein
MFNFSDLSIPNDIGSGGMQDIYALIVFGTEHKGTFVDIGCRHSVLHNNTYLLEEYGWKGIAVDIANYTDDWNKYRPNTKYFNSCAFSVNYLDEFEAFGLESPIDFLSIDLENGGDRFRVLEQIIGTGYEFKAITIEHDAYCQDENQEKIPQRNFLKERGYVLVKECEVIEDFWINPKYISLEQYELIIQHNKSGADQIPPQNFLQAKGYDWSNFYDKIDMEKIKELV